MNLSLVKELIVHNKHKGAFAVELALTLIFTSGILAIIINYLIVTNKKGQMDRAAYSMATLVAERKQLFDMDLDICTGNCNQAKNELFSVVSASMRRNLPSYDQNKFGMRVDAVYLNGSSGGGGGINYSLRTNSLTAGRTANCDFPNVSSMSKAKALSLLPETTSGTKLPLYQVSLCYETPFNILGVMNNEVLRVVSTSYAFARI